MQKFKLYGLEIISHSTPIDLFKPEFEKAERIHDWRNYVPQEFKEAWPQLSRKEKLILLYFACKQADEEDWD